MWRDVVVLAFYVSWAYGAAGPSSRRCGGGRSRGMPRALVTPLLLPLTHIFCTSGPVLQLLPKCVCFNHCPHACLTPRAHPALCSAPLACTPCTPARLPPAVCYCLMGVLLPDEYANTRWACYCLPAPQCPRRLCADGCVLWPGLDSRLLGFWGPGQCVGHGIVISASGLIHLNQDLNLSNLV